VAADKCECSHFDLIAQMGHSKSKAGCFSFWIRVLTAHLLLREVAKESAPEAFTLPGAVFFCGVTVSGVTSRLA
jgi:hypothetical protein